MPTSPTSQAATPNLVYSTVAFALCFSAWGLMAPLARRFEDDLGLSSVETSVLIAIPVVLGSVLRVPVGWLTDRYGGRIMFPVVLLASAPPALALGFVESYRALVVVGFFLGLSGSAFAVGVPFVAGWYEQARQGFAVGIYGVGNIGTAVAAFSAPAIVDAWSRPALGVLAAAILVGGAVLFWLRASDPPGERPSTRYRDVLRAGWRLWRLTLFYFLTFGGFVAMAVFLPKLLVDWFDLSLVDAGLRAAGFTVVATGARPLGGWLSDRYGAYPVLVLAFAGIAVDAAVLATMAARPEMLQITLASLSMAFFLGAGNGAVFKLVPAEFPANAGAAAGIVGAAGGLGGFFPPLVMGVVKDWLESYALGFVGLLVFTSACLALAVWLLRTAPAHEVRGGAGA
jgi:NNP family nitrate/nitrite transporter-like MFS transporter